MGTLDPARLRGNVGQERWAFLVVGAVYEGGQAVCQHSRSCCQGNDMYNCPSVYSCQQKQPCRHIFPLVLHSTTFTEMVTVAEFVGHKS